MWGPSMLAILAVLFLLLAGFGVSAASGPVERVRVERFASRQRLSITATTENT